MINSRVRTLCLGVAVLLLGAAAATRSPQPEARADITASAIVNAPIVRIASPFNGLVEHAAPARGAAVHPGDRLVRVKATQDDRQTLSELKTRLASMQRQIAVTHGHIKALSDARAELQTRMDNYRTGTIDRLAAQLKEAEALHNIFKARLAQSDDSLQRQQQLKTKGYASQANFDAATASAIVAKNDVAASAARIQRIRVDLESAKRGVFVGDARDDVPYSQQRDDEIMLRLVDLDAKLKSLQATSQEIQGQLAAEVKRVAVGEVYDQTASMTGVVLETASMQGAPVRAGDPLVNVLDCGRTFLEVSLDESQTAGITPGDTAKVRLPGVEAAIDAKVRGLRGAIASAAGDQSGAESLPPTSGQAIVLVDLPMSADSGSMQSFCHVGRTAEVVFERSRKQPTRTAKQPKPKAPVRRDISALDGVIPASVIPASTR
jgi:multidrug resistance efflux pump